MAEDKKTYIDDVHKAGWLKHKGVEVNAVLKDGKVYYEAPAADTTRTTLNLLGLRPHVDLNDYITVLEKLNAEARSLEDRSNKGEGEKGK